MRRAAGPTGTNSIPKLVDVEERLGVSLDHDCTSRAAELTFQRAQGLLRERGAVIRQLAALYRDGTLIREVLRATTAKSQHKRRASTSKGAMARIVQRFGIQR
jgi:hypothetical protein